MDSGKFQVNWVDFCKGVKAFAYNFFSLLVPVTAFLLTVPQEQIPPAFLGVVAMAPFINGLAVVIIRWYQDNR